MKFFIQILLAFVLISLWAGCATAQKPLNNASAQNERLSKELRWTWGKPQRGWFLYESLIQRTIDSDARLNTKEFADAVADWQRRKRLKADGVIGSGTLYALIREWQSKRIKPIYEAKESDLLTASIDFFYDPTRDIELLKVDKKAFEAYKAMVKAAEKELGRSNGESGRYFSIISSYRSPAYQRSLRKKNPKLNRAQLARKSPHFTGRALDLYVGGEPVTTADPNRTIQVKTKAYKWLVENAHKYGFQPYFYEPWHWEYVGE